MPALTPDDVHTATETLSRLTEYLRDTPDPGEALALVEPLLDEYAGIPIQLGDTLRALARTVLDHPDTPRTPDLHVLVAKLRTAAWEQTDQHTLHYALDNLRALLTSASPNTPEYCWCR
ncbi:hypothetical protein [Streptomyces chromofuscus]|uniref:Uncharacterized protein n=1 Tax=Streptomyces chromofuscus TaxID=42881 RepID=A0A7M2T2T3_STRCW|nr:hypothetical protein [Streptomyces chromofuscus]QOV42990.1 hypothetical protein IPT68_24845 [Streptomyces chromofuscus]GGS92781.1 hypothetical protein GCM10010254_10890 [Streptomyces chromofuscus]